MGFWDEYFSFFCVGLVCLPLPLGFIWLWTYRARKDLGLPDWLSGLLAHGIISGHRIEHGGAEDADYGFILMATLLLVTTLSCVATLLF